MTQFDKILVSVPFFSKVSRNTLIVFVLTFLYSILRYNIFGNIPPADIPTLIVNKSVSFSMILILLNASISYLYKKLDDYYGYLDLFKTFAIIHVILSVALLSQNYYPKLFSTEKLTLLGNFSLLAGVMAFVYILNKRYKIKNIILYSLTAAHLIFIGFTGWFDIKKWNGFMPPITLICFLILVALIILSVLHKNPRYISYKNASEKLTIKALQKNTLLTYNPQAHSNQSKKPSVPAVRETTKILNTRLGKKPLQ